MHLNKTYKLVGLSLAFYPICSGDRTTFVKEIGNNKSWWNVLQFLAHPHKLKKNSYVRTIWMMSKKLTMSTLFSQLIYFRDDFIEV